MKQGAKVARLVFPTFLRVVFPFSASFSTASHTCMCSFQDDLILFKVPPEDSNVLVWGLPDSVTCEELRTLFQAFGPVYETQILCASTGLWFHVQCLQFCCS